MNTPRDRYASVAFSMRRFSNPFSSDVQVTFPFYEVILIQTMSYLVWLSTRLWFKVILVARKKLKGFKNSYKSGRTFEIPGRSKPDREGKEQRPEQNGRHYPQGWDCCLSMNTRGQMRPTHCNGRPVFVKETHKSVWLKLNVSAN